MDTTDGRRVVVPLSAVCSTTLVKVGGLLDVAQSRGPIIKVAVATADDRQAVKDFKVRVLPYATLATLQCCWEGVKECGWYDRKRAFSSFVPSSVSGQSAFVLAQALRRGEAFSEANVQALNEIAQAAYNYYDEEPDRDKFLEALTRWMVREARVAKKHGEKVFGMFPDADVCPVSFFCDKGE